MSSRIDEENFDEHYSDDPLDNDPVEKPRVLNKLMPLFLTVVLVVIGSSYAANVNLNIGNSSEFGQGLLRMVACDSNGVILKPENEMTTSNSESNLRISSISISDIAADCSGKSFQVKIYDSNSQEPLSSTGFLKSINFLYSPGDSQTTDRVSIEEGLNSIKLTFVLPMALSSSASKFTIESHERVDEIQGLLDVSFANPAILSSSVGRTDNGKKLLIDEEGNYYLLISSRSGSSWEIVVRKYLDSGDVDQTYGNSGVARFSISNSLPLHGVLDRSKNLYIVSMSVGVGALSRITKISQSGTIVSDFANNGSLIISVPGADRTYIEEIAFDKNERLAIGGHSCNDTAATCNPYVARVNQNGNLDEGFAIGGIKSISTATTVYGNAIVVDTQQRIYLAGDSSDGIVGDIYVFRISDSGEMDLTFGTAGAVLLDFGTISETCLGMTLNPRGGVYLAGYTRVSGQDKALIASLNTTGALDSRFSSNGYLTIAPNNTKDYWASNIEVGETGDVFINLADMDSDPNARLGFVAKVSANGVLSTNFGSSGFLSFNNTAGSLDTVADLSITSNNKLAVVGSTGLGRVYFALVR